MKCIYIGEELYLKSGTVMSCIYTEAGARSDWSEVSRVLAGGESVIISPATPQAAAAYEARLADLLSSRQAAAEEARVAARAKLGARAGAEP